MIFAPDIEHALKSAAAKELKTVILCIGSDRITGDCLGPVVGHILTHELCADADVYGSLSSPVTALNLSETLSFIKSRHPGSFVIAVDSSLGAKEDVGNVRVLPCGIFPGAAVGKNLPKVGDAAVTATVAELSGTKGANLLQGVRLGFIYRLAYDIAKGICNALSA
jgi:putative sporulation protein YyaC